MSRLRLAAAVCAVLVAGAPALAKKAKLPHPKPSPDGARSMAIYPPQEVPFAFTHKVHLATGILSCDDCHKHVKESGSSSDRLIPGHAQCKDCHVMILPQPGSTKKLANDCSLCHRGWKKGQTVPPPAGIFPAAHIRFSHAKHLDRGARCRDCHGKLFKVAKASRQQLPTMSTCFTCHDDVHASRACDLCHETGFDGRLRTTYPTGTLKPAEDPLHMDHDAGWMTGHVLPGKLQSATCDACHTKKYCIDCHDGTLKPFGIHPADWITTHPVAARQDSIACSGCHRRQSFCITCHERSGIGVDAPAGVVAGADPASGPTFHAPDCSKMPAGSCQNLRFHPKGWIDLANQTSPHFHAWAARRNIMACASCHREETCLRCHATGQMSGLNFTPHPPGFDAVCRAMATRNPRSCLKCHKTVPGKCL